MDYKIENRIHDIESKIDKLYSKLDKMINNLKDYPTTALIEARKSLETICKVIITVEKLHFNKTSLSDMIKAIENKKKAPKDILISMRTVQHYGNIGAHDQGDFKLNPYSSEICLRHLSIIIDWFVKEYEIHIQKELPNIDSIRLKKNIRIDFSDKRRTTYIEISTTEFELYTSIYENVRLASFAPTFESALEIINNINPGNIRDPELMSYYLYSKSLAEFCVTIGIPRNSKYSNLNVLININKIAFIKYLFSKGTLFTIEQIKRLKTSGENYFKIDKKLERRYKLNN